MKQQRGSTLGTNAKSTTIVTTYYTDGTAEVTEVEWIKDGVWRVLSTTPVSPACPQHGSQCR